MNGYIVYAVSLVLVFNCVISVAKNSEEIATTLSQNVTDHHESENNILLTAESSLNPIYSDSGVSVASTKPRIMPRKGVSPNSTEMVDPSSNTVTSKMSTTTLNATLANATIIPPNVKTGTVPSTTTTPNPTTPRSTTVTTTTTTASTTTTTKKPVRKPSITYSADDNSQILDLEKNINYTAIKTEETAIVPNMSPDIDRTVIDEEKSTRSSYIIFMGCALALPMAFTLVHVMYKKIRNWMEVRHYQRVVSLSFIVKSTC